MGRLKPALLLDTRGVSGAGGVNKYEGYRSWLENLDLAPEVERVSAPRQKFFLDSQYGTSHKIVEWTRPLWIQKANTMPMHDLDLGATSIRRQFEQFEHLFDYVDPDALDESLQRWITAATPYDRYNVAMDIEENILTTAAAQKFGADPRVIRAVYRKTLNEQNKMFAAIRQGQGQIYSTAPSLRQRLEVSENVELVNYDAENKMLTLELMDGGRRTTVKVPEEALVEKARPVDPTQTPNYYQPVDTRRFYLALKRNEEILQDLSHPNLRLSEAALMDAIDKVGTVFNALWKPLVRAPLTLTAISSVAPMISCICSQMNRKSSFTRSRRLAAPAVSPASMSRNASSMACWMACVARKRSMSP